MPSKEDKTSQFDRLRQRAEEVIKSQKNVSLKASSDMVELIHELEIHQAELAIQNEELQRSQVELSDLHREFANLYEFAPYGYLTLNGKGVITRANLTAVGLLGANRKFLYGSGISQYFADDYYKVYLQAINTYLATREKQSVEIPLKSTTEIPIWVRIDFEAEFDETDAVILWRVVLIDISKQRQAEEAKSKVENQLRQAQKMEAIGNLAGGIAHDFNNILTIILGFTETALGEVEEGTMVQSDLQAVYNAGKRAKDLVSQILTFSQQNNEDLETMQIAGVVTELLSLLRASIPANIILKKHIESDSLVIGNISILQQVFLNLVSNAVDAMEENGGTLDFDVCDIIIEEAYAKDHDLLGPGKYVRVTVSDTGVGIPPEVIKSIYDPYFTTKEFGKGTGMGLATSYGTVKRYGGTIQVKSSPGHGATFTVLLPVSLKNNVSESHQPESLPRGSERILYVDDEKLIVKLAKRILENLGYHVTTRSSSSEALELFKEKPFEFDLVITDMTMPHHHGNTLAKEMLKIRKDISIILCTGYSNKISHESASEIGIKKFAYKPLQSSDLAKVVRKVLDEA